MVQRTGLLLMGLIALVGIGVLFYSSGVTGNYYATGGGKWYYGWQIAQFMPKDACEVRDCTAVSPIEVYTNQYGSQFAVCDCFGERVGVPMVQKIYVPN